MRGEMTFLQGVRRVLLWIEDGILVGLLLLMMGLAVFQILMRNFLGSGIVWGDVLVRILVLWTGLIGAMAASRGGNHITVDLVTRFLPPPLRCASAILVNLFTAGICFVATVYGTRFVLMEYETGMTAFAQVPIWVCEAVIPVAFAVISFRYLVHAALDLRAILRTVCR